MMLRNERDERKRRKGSGEKSMDSENERRSEKENREAGNLESSKPQNAI